MKKINNICNCIWFNNHYYMLSDKDGIIMCDSSLDVVRRISSTSDYKVITYNDSDNNFYVCKDSKLYKSNDLRSFSLVSLLNHLDEIKDISYCKCFNSILITTRKSVYMFNLCNKHIKKIYCVKEEIIEINDCMEPLGCFNQCNIILVSAICCCDEIYVAYTINGMSYISKLVNGELGKAVYQVSGIIKSMFLINNEVWVLVNRNCHQELLYTCIDCDCGCKPSDDCKCHIIDSIALIEKSLAKILNSEGEKIQAAIEKTDNVDDLICINSSVKDVIYYITILEFILVEKLKAVEDKKDCDC